MAFIGGCQAASQAHTHLALFELDVLALLEKARANLRALGIKHDGAHAFALLQRLADVGDGLAGAWARSKRRLLYGK